MQAILGRRLSKRGAVESEPSSVFRTKQRYFGRAVETEGEAVPATPKPAEEAKVEEEELTVGEYRRRKLDSYVSLRAEQCDGPKRWISVDLAREDRLNSYLYGNHTQRYAKEERHLSMQMCTIEDGQGGWQVRTAAATTTSFPVPPTNKTTSDATTISLSLPTNRRCTAWVPT